MEHKKIISESGHVIIKQCFLARSFPLRLRGLIGREPLKSDQAMLIEPCWEIHTLFMSFAIDVIFLKKQSAISPKHENNSVFYTVVKTVSHLPAGRFFGAGDARASATLELAPGWLDSQLIQIGDKLWLS